MVGPPAGPWTTLWRNRLKGLSLILSSRAFRMQATLWIGSASLSMRTCLVLSVAMTYAVMCRQPTIVSPGHCCLVQRSPEVSQFASKYDAYLRGEVQLTAQESQGLVLFNGQGKCSACHISEAPRPLFTDFTYDNLGVPRNPQNPFYFEPEWNPDGLLWVDKGLGGFLEVRAISMNRSWASRRSRPCATSTNVQARLCESVWPQRLL